MPNRLTHIVDAIRTRDYAVATESIAQVLQQKVEQSLAQERQRLATTLVREEVLTEMPALYDAGPDEETFLINTRAFGGPDRSYTFSSLKAAGIPQEAMRACYSPYENLQGFAIKKKYAKKAAKVLNLESVTNPAIAKFNAEDHGLMSNCKTCHHPMSDHSEDGCDRKGCRCMVSEANDVKGPLGCNAKHKGGAVCRLKAGHDGKHQATAGEAHYIWEDSKSLSMKCQECGKVFKSASMDPKCPKCGGYDIDLSEATNNDVKVVKSKNGRGWDIVIRGEVVEGGFFEKNAAEDAAEFYRNSKDFQVAEGKEYDPSSAKRHECPKCKHVWWGVALKTCPKCDRKISEDYGADKATPGKCAKCGKPAQWYHNRLDKKFCADCAPNDTMSRIQKEAWGDEDGSGSKGPWDRVKAHRCPHCAHLWYGPTSETECPKCYKDEYEAKGTKDV